MSGLLEVRLEHEQHQLRGVLRFDGEVVEIFGFNDVHSRRIHIHDVSSAEASFKSGIIAMPTLKLHGKAGSIGYAQGIEPPPEQQPEIEDFVAAINKAVQETA